MRPFSDENFSRGNSKDVLCHRRRRRKRRPWAMPPNASGETVRKALQEKKKTPADLIVAVEPLYYAHAADDDGVCGRYNINFFNFFFH